MQLFEVNFWTPLRKEQRRIEIAIKISGLPFIKSIDEFDFTFQPGLNRQKVMSLFDLSFIKQNGNIIFMGPPGVGKTHLAVSLALKACQAGISIYFTNMEDLIKKLKKDHEAGKSGKGRMTCSMLLWYWIFHICWQ
jgi:DNA replication protein DnaC